MISIINLVKSEDVCLDNSVLTCYCQTEMEYVSCNGKSDANDSFVDWSSFTSVNHRRYSFTFINLTRLTSSTFTNFTSTFPSIDLVIQFTFISGLDEIGENAFKELNYYSNEPIDITFTSPGNFQLADYAFGQGRYFEIIIDSIQYSSRHSLPYEFNLKSMDGSRFYQMSIINSGQIEFVSIESSTIKFTAALAVTNCSLTNVSLLIESLYPSIVDLDLSSNKLISIPSLMNFQEMREIDLKNNLIEEITSNIFNNMANLWRIDLSNNRIRNIEPDSFVGVSLIELELNTNLLISLETLTTDNKRISFLDPLNTSLAFFGISNNYITDLNPLKSLTNLDNLTLCCMKINKLDANMFSQANQLEWIDLSYNQIQFIDPMAFNGTIIRYLDLAGNPLSSIETTIQHTQNETSSYLYPISSTILTLSFSNCTNLMEINWFVISKLDILSELNLSQLNKIDSFWTYRKTDINDQDSIINWNYPPGPRFIFNGIRFSDNDYCLTRPISYILNKTNFIIDIDHPCNCFIFKFKDLLDAEQRPNCILNDSLINELTNQCENIDSFCELFINGTTNSPFLEWTSSSLNSITSLSLSPMTAMDDKTIMTTVSPILTFESSTITREDSSISNSKTSTQLSLKPSNKKQTWKIILATTIPLICIFLFGSMIVYLLKRRKRNKFDGTFEMKQTILFHMDEQ
jgi:Leucine-rich repeat (LRR) protein